MEQECLIVTGIWQAGAFQGPPVISAEAMEQIKKAVEGGFHIAGTIMFEGTTRAVILVKAK